SSTRSRKQRPSMRSNDTSWRKSKWPLVKRRSRSSKKSFGKTSPHSLCKSWAKSRNLSAPVSCSRRRGLRRKVQNNWPPKEPIDQWGQCVNSFFQLVGLCAILVVGAALALIGFYRRKLKR